jgi:hypothetical protein
MATAGGMPMMNAAGSNNWTLGENSESGGPEVQLVTHQEIVSEATAFMTRKLRALQEATEQTRGSGLGGSPSGRHDGRSSNDGKSALRVQKENTELR